MTTSPLSPPTLAAAKRSIIRHEGIVPKVYLDSLGYKTAGIGHLLTGSDRGLSIGTQVSQQQVDNWFESDLEEAIRIANQAVAPMELDSLSPARQVILVDMAFNLGPKLLQFKNTLSAIKSGSYEQAADMMLQSKWASQVGRRAQELSESMRTGVIDWL